MPATKRPYLKRRSTRKWLVASAIVLAVIFFARFTTEFVLKRVGENLFSEILKTQVEVGSVAIGSLGGDISFYNTRIRNLKGFSKPYIFKAQVIRIKGSLWDLLVHNKLDIELISIDHVQTWIQKNKQGYNYQKLLTNLQSPSPDESEEQEDRAARENAEDSHSSPETSNSEDNDIFIAEIRIQDVKTTVYDFIPSTHISSSSEENARLDLAWKTIVLRQINLGKGGQSAARHLSSIITESLLTASARRVGSLPLNLLKEGFSLGGATLDIMSKETHPDTLKDSIHTVSRGASEWLHDLIPESDKKSHPPAQPQNHDQR